MEVLQLHAAHVVSVCMGPLLLWCRGQTLRGAECYMPHAMCTLESWSGAGRLEQAEKKDRMLRDGTRLVRLARRLGACRRGAPRARGESPLDRRGRDVSRYVAIRTGQWRYVAIQCRVECAPRGGVSYREREGVELT